MNVKVDGHKLIADRALWRRVARGYERERLFLEPMRRFHHTSKRYMELKQSLAQYDEETLRMLDAGGMITRV